MFNGQPQKLRNVAMAMGRMGRSCNSAQMSRARAKGTLALVTALPRALPTSTCHTHGTMA
jgi:hypothetical protein